MTWRARAVAHSVSWVAALLMAACAVVPQAPEAATSEALSGRLTVQVEATASVAARSMSAGFDLQGNSQTGRLNLSTPLGTVLAQARWAPGSVVLATPQGEKRFADLDALTQEVLGESLPVAALFDWLRGRPWPEAASAAQVAPAGPGFEQLGWAIDLARFDEAWVAARRERAPVVTVRAKLDRP